MTRAVALLSGGLDSTLAIKVIQDQGIEVEALNFLTAFCRCTPNESCKLAAKTASETLGVQVRVINATERFLDILRKPKHGFGKNMNPCIDCRIQMFREAGRYMRESGADFIITGEVLGQRPMSQRRDAMILIDKEAEVTGYVLRPLCAKHLEPTIPEKEGLIDRSLLLEIKGRSRKEQIHLADVFHLKDYPCPAGGCLLTDPGFAARLREFMKHSELTVNDVHLLKLGRHFRLDPDTKVVVGRNEAENSKIRSFAHEGDAVLMIQDIPGPLTLVRGDTGTDNLCLAARLTVRYCSKTSENGSTKVMVLPARGDVSDMVLDVEALAQEEVDRMMIIGDKVRRKQSKLQEG